MKTSLEKIQDRLDGIKDKPLWLLRCSHCKMTDISRAPRKPEVCWRCRSRGMMSTKVPKGYLLIKEEEQYV